MRDLLADGGEQFAEKSNPLARVLHRWYSENEFLDENGRPATLPFGGDTGSFSALVKKFGGDIPPGAMRTELKRVAAVEEDECGNIRAIRRDVRPKADFENLCLALVHGAYPLLSNIAHNTNPKVEEASWAELTTYTASVQESDIPRLRRICNDRAKEAAESFDDLFGAYEKLDEGDVGSNMTRPVAIGIFYFEEKDEKANSIWKTS